MLIPPAFSSEVSKSKIRNELWKVQQGRSYRVKLHELGGENITMQFNSSAKSRAKH